MDYKRLPYGVADYTWIKSQNRYCADKTMFIPKMEDAGDFLYLIRQGFIAAYLNHSGYYYLIQEMELNGGYCDLTMIPDLTRFPEVAHAYLLELKYLKTGDTDEEGNKALEEARTQLEQYAQDTRLPQLMNGKPIHKIAIIYKGNDLWKITEC